MDNPLLLVKKFQDHSPLPRTQFASQQIKLPLKLKANNYIKCNHIYSEYIPFNAPPETKKSLALNEECIIFKSDRADRCNRKSSPPTL